MFPNQSDRALSYLWITNTFHSQCNDVDWGRVVHKTKVVEGSNRFGGYYKCEVVIPLIIVVKFTTVFFT